MASSDLPGKNADVLSDPISLQTIITKTKGSSEPIDGNGPWQLTNTINFRTK
jgi:hypothetical protein